MPKWSKFSVTSLVKKKETEPQSDRIYNKHLLKNEWIANYAMRNKFA